LTEKKNTPIKKSKGQIYFLISTILIFIVLTLINAQKGLDTLIYLKNILIKVIPILILVFVLSFVVNYFIKPKKLIKYLGKDSKYKGWMIAILSGIISSGPIYMWYPLLKELKDKGMRIGLIATFLYNRAIKIPLLPLLIVYFGLKYSIVLLIIMVIFSVLQGLTIEKLMIFFNKKQNKNSRGIKNE